MRALSLVAASGGCSLLWYAGFSLWWLFLLLSTGSRRVGFSSCGAWAELLCSVWDPPGPGLEPVSPALAGIFLTTASPGKPGNLSFKSPQMILIGLLVKNHDHSVWRVVWPLGSL